MANDQYKTFKVNESTVYIQKDRINSIKKVDAIVFDCDGVLIDTRESYDQVVKIIVRTLTETLGGIQPDSINVLDEWLFEIRNTGGFNNDWNLSYALIAFILNELPLERIQTLTKIFQKSSVIQNPHQRYQTVKKETEKLNSINIKPQNITKFASNLKSEGLPSLIEFLEKTDNPDFYRNLQIVLSYPGKVSESILTTMFEEFFYGKALFEGTFETKTRYNFNNIGYIEKEKIEVTEKTLSDLLRTTKGKKFGVASGSFQASAEHMLRDFLHFFNPEASVWMDQVDEAIEETNEKGLHKPHPYSLNTASKALQPYNCLLYVGDSQADFTMVQKTCNSKILFTGVYGLTKQWRSTRQSFLKNGADIIIESVNDLPPILYQLKEETR